MIRVFTMAAAAALCVGVAHAADYVVVRSTDPAIEKGATFDAGAKVAPAAGTTVSILSSGGALTTVRSATTLPPIAAGANTTTASALSGILQRPPPRRISGVTRGATVCLPLEELKTLDDILAAEAAGCRVNARLALDAYVERQAAETKDGADATAPATDAGKTETVKTEESKSE